MGQSERSAANDDGGKFWRLQGVYIERLDTGGLRIWVGGRQVFLGAESADSLLDWMERSQAPADVAHLPGPTNETSGMGYDG